MLNFKIKDAPDFFRTSIFNMKKYYLKVTHELLSTKSYEKIIFPIYYHKAIDLIESKIYKTLTPKSKKKIPQNMCSRLFENKGVEFVILGFHFT